MNDVYISHGQDEAVPVGFALDIPDGYYVTVETRSGHGLNKSLRLHRGIIDQGFRGEMSVRVYNHSSHIDYKVSKGEKIGQLVLHKIEVLPLMITELLSETARGEAKCGSTDKK